MVPLMGTRSVFDEKQDIHRLYLEERIHHNSYFEKLAILDGGTVALVITAVIGPLHGNVRHKYTLEVGLTIPVVAMLMLLVRNFLAARYEFYAVRDTLDGQASKQGRRLEDFVHYTGLTGILLSVVGIVLLLIEVWLIIV
jgi:hypothetical protein